MADNVAITAGSGTTVATDDVGGVHYQKVKLAIGAADTANLLSVGSGAIDTGTPRVALATDSPGVTALGQSNALGSLPTVEASDSVLVTSIKVDDAAFTPGTSTIQMIGMQADEGSTDSVDEGDAGCPRMTLDRKQIVVPQPHTAGGLTIFRSLDLDESEEEVKASAGCLYKLRIANFATSARYVKLYNATAANVTVGTTTPVDTIPVPPAAAAGNPTIITEAFGGIGVTFDTAICLAATTALADNDTGAPAANDVVVTAYYK